MYDTFIFDLDGTLVTLEMDFKALRKELEEILCSHGFPEDKIAWDISIVDSLDLFREEMAILKLDGDSAVNDVIARVYEYEVERAEHTVAIPGARETLSHLRDKGYKIAVATRNNKDAALVSLENAGLLPYVDTLLSREDAERLKPHPDQFERALKRLGTTPEKAIVVGDYTYEITAGKTLGCLTIGVLSGGGNEDDLKEADIIVESVAELQHFF